MTDRKPARGPRNLGPIVILVLLVLAAGVALIVVQRHSRLGDADPTAHSPTGQAAPAQPSTVPDRQQPATGPEANEQQNSGNEVGGTESTANKTAG